MTPGDALRAGDVAGALAAATAAVKTAPTNADARWLMAEILLVTGDAERADRMLDAAALQEPNPAVLEFRRLLRAEVTRGQVLREGRAPKYQGDDATPAQQAALRARMLLRLGDAAAAATAARAVQLAPGNARTIDLLGWILVQQGQLDAGLRHLRDARLREPGNVETRFHLAVALHKAGRKAEAREELAVVLAAAGRAPLPPDVARLKAELGA